MASTLNIIVKLNYIIHAKCSSWLIMCSKHDDEEEEEEEGG